MAQSRAKHRASDAQDRHPGSTFGPSDAAGWASGPVGPAFGPDGPAAFGAGWASGPAGLPAGSVGVLDRSVEETGSWRNLAATSPQPDRRGPQHAANRGESTATLRLADIGLAPQRPAGSRRGAHAVVPPPRSVLPISQQTVCAALSATVIGASVVVAAASAPSGAAAPDRGSVTQTLRLAAFTGPVAPTNPRPRPGQVPSAAAVSSAGLAAVQQATVTPVAPPPAAVPAPRAAKPAAKAAPAAAPVAAIGSGVGAAALAMARTKIGKPYVWGAAGPNSFDCSGLVMWAFKQVGVNLPHSSAAQSTMGTAVSRDQLQPGDLVFFYTPVSHVGIYVGNGQVLNATESGQPVKISSMAYLPFHNARRL